MVNKIIEEILETEKQADDIVADAREKSKAMLADTAAMVDALYTKAEQELKNDVEKILFAADKKADAAAESIVLASKKQTALVIQKAEGKFEPAVKRVLAALEER